MARLVLFSQDKQLSGDAVLDAARYDRGMVVDVLPDGVSLGKEGDKSPLFFVVEFPGASVEKLRFLLAGDEKDVAQAPDAVQVLRRRVQKVDLKLVQELAVDSVAIGKIVQQPEKMKEHFSKATLAVVDLVDVLPVEFESFPGGKP